MDPNQAMAYITAEIIHEVRARYPDDLATEILRDGSVFFYHNGDNYIGTFDPSKETANRSTILDSLTFQSGAGTGTHQLYPGDMNCE